VRAGEHPGRSRLWCPCGLKPSTTLCARSGEHSAPASVIVAHRAPSTVRHHPRIRDHTEEPAMAAASLKNQARIIAHEKKILRNQHRLARILDNQGKILRSLQAMLKNQRKILANQGRILAK
jgi:hypothetical protein